MERIKLSIGEMQERKNRIIGLINKYSENCDHDGMMMMFDDKAMCIECAKAMRKDLFNITGH
ncbi:MAG TPA: hypothetical protein DDX29_01290 [Clostridiales bacterium]|nr:hypothetical protein [Clostridiales bacterium]